MTPTVGQSVAVGTLPDGKVGTALVTLDVQNEPMERVLRMIARQAGLQLYMDKDKVPANTRVSLRMKGVSASDAFTRALAGTGLQARVSGGQVVFSSESSTATSPVAQGGISGKVVDAKTKQGLRGATVSLNGTNTGTTSSEDGSFRVSGVVSGSYTMQVRMLGYIKTTKSVTIVEGQVTFVEIVLEPSVNALDQVIVTGTVAATAQRAIPNAMTVVTAKEIEQRGITHIDQLFRGDIPGLFSQNLGSLVGIDSVAMFSRGASTLRVPSSFPQVQSNAIKTYVDGVELANPTYLAQIDPRSIERIEIIAGPQASTIYGSNAINGVMQIFTKRGHTTKPQLTASLFSGLVENEFRPALTPQHDYSGQVSGTDGRWSYNAGSSWNRMGKWTPAKQTTRFGGFGGARMRAGPVGADVSVRANWTRNRQDGVAEQALVDEIEQGMYRYSGSTVLSPPKMSIQRGQTIGLTLSVTPTAWWSHEIGMGRDMSESENWYTGLVYTSPSDSVLFFRNTRQARTSARYATTAKRTWSSTAQVTVTAGFDHWQNSSLYIVARSLTGSLASPTATRAKPERNTGGFVQSQLGFADAVFFTYGARLEWNPNYGALANPNIAPRIGIALARDVGSLTAKLRGSYGRATRPPREDQRMQAMLSPTANGYPTYGDVIARFENPELTPEYQKGGEGGMDLYFGTRTSLTVTRYNQTVDALIAEVRVDSVASILPNSTGKYDYLKQTQNLNIGSIRNQGWEVQNTTNAGPLSVRGTYSWTKSRMIGVTPRYRGLTVLTAGLEPGSSFLLFPEHTWALQVGYARRQTNATLSMNGIGRLTRNPNEVRAPWDTRRLPLVNTRMVRPLGWRDDGPGYTMADFNLSHRVTSHVEGVLQVHNLTNFYQNDRSDILAVLGRQIKTGARIRM